MVSFSPANMRLISLTTDFGLADPFVGTMKGVIAGICPEARVIDVTHGVEAFNILDGAIKLWQAARYFPSGTIHVAVVDPGVGSTRRALLARIGKQWFIAPDNGLLSWVLEDSGSDTEAWLLQNPEYFLAGPSHTFHGRDIFAPVAAHLAAGVAPENFGPRLTASDAPLVRLASLPLDAAPEGETEGQIVLVDRFGNLLTNLRGSSLPEHFELEVGGRLIRDYLTNYAAGQPGIPFAIVGSSGLLEIAVTQGSAADVLGLRTGARVWLRKKNGPEESGPLSS
jgi:S-adenosylmethionine hydrolase